MTEETQTKSRAETAKFKFEFMMLMLLCGSNDEAQRAAQEVLDILAELIEAGH